MTRFPRIDVFQDLINKEFESVQKHLMSGGDVVIPGTVHFE